MLLEYSAKGQEYHLERLQGLKEGQPQQAALELVPIPDLQGRVLRLSTPILLKVVHPPPHLQVRVKERMFWVRIKDRVLGLHRLQETPLAPLKGLVQAPPQRMRL